MSDIKGKKILMVVAPDKFRDEELFDTKRVIESFGGTVEVASLTLYPAKGMKGGSVTPDLKLQDVHVDDYDAVVFVGGSGAQVYFDNQYALNLAKKAYEKGKVLGAICIAPCILANAGLLEGKDATVWFGSEFVSLLKSKGANYTGEAVEVDGNIVTANGPMSAKDFGKVIVTLLSKSE